MDIKPKMSKTYCAKKTMHYLGNLILVLAAAKKSHSTGPQMDSVI